MKVEFLFDSMHVGEWLALIKCSSTCGSPKKCEKTGINFFFLILFQHRAYLCLYRKLWSFHLD